MLDRGVRRAITAAGDDGYPFQVVGPLLREADLALANLECPLTRATAPLPKRVTFRCDPRMASALQRAGFDLLGLANNHACDFGRDALVETRDTLERVGISTVGAGMSQPEAARPTILEIAGRRIGVLAFVDLALEGLSPSDAAPGPAMAEPDRVASSVREARSLADSVVVTVHWGSEYRSFPNARQRALARIIADAGADLIIGHHPHVVQPVERLGRTWVFYSLGNLVFDQHCPGCDRGLLVAATLADAVTVRVMPIRIRQGQPAPSTGEEARLVAEGLTRLSAELHVLPDSSGWWDLHSRR
jgi:poly-gamma-glutamate synthesis protein (capsule biosynthesis protein)